MARTAPDEQLKCSTTVLPWAAFFILRPIPNFFPNLFSHPLPAHLIDPKKPGPSIS